jgi:hypothetical protein
MTRTISAVPNPPRPKICASPRIAASTLADSTARDEVDPDADEHTPLRGPLQGRPPRVGQVMCSDV